jgi:hypothetical protein
MLDFLNNFDRLTCVFRVGIRNPSRKPKAYKDSISGELFLLKSNPLEGEMKRFSQKMPWQKL